MSGHIYVHEGKRYRTAARRAGVGEKIVIVKADMSDGQYRNGNILTTKEQYSYAGKAKGVYVSGIDIGIRDYEYLTLVEIESEECCENEPTVDTSQASEQVIEMLANLARRVTSLESQLRDTQGNVERQAEEIAQTRHSGHNNLLDIREIYGRLKETEDKVEMALDDIVTLDSRTQVVNSITKFYEEGRR